MTPEQIEREIIFYIERQIIYYSMMCDSLFGGTAMTIDSIEVYSESEKQSAKAEIAYYHAKGELPLWAMVIERVEVVDGSRIFIHRDRGKDV